MWYYIPIRMRYVCLVWTNIECLALFQTFLIDALRTCYDVNVASGFQIIRPLQECHSRNEMRFKIACHPESLYCVFKK